MPQVRRNIDDWERVASVAAGAALIAVAPAVKDLQVGDGVVVPFAIASGACEPCRDGLWALCDNSNPNASMLETLYGSSGPGLFGYSHLYGGYAGGQAEYVRVPIRRRGSRQGA